MPKRTFHKAKDTYLRRMIKLIYKHKLSHIGSCVSAFPTIKEIFEMKAPEDLFILSAGHAGMALYAIMEKHGLGDAEEMLKTCGIHPDRKHPAIICSTGSLGHGLPIALGMALGNPDKKVYCLISDGETMEGSIWEALRVADDLKIKNLFIHVNINGWGAYSRYVPEVIGRRLMNYAPELFHNGQLEFHFTKTRMVRLPFLEDSQDAHYKVMSDDDYQKFEEMYG